MAGGGQDDTCGRILEAGLLTLPMAALSIWIWIWLPGPGASMVVLLPRILLCVLAPCTIFIILVTIIVTEPPPPSPTDVVVVDPKPEPEPEPTRGMAGRKIDCGRWFFILFMGLVTLAMVALAIRLPGPKDPVLDMVMRIQCVLASCTIFIILVTILVTEPPPPPPTDVVVVVDPEPEPTRAMAGGKIDWGRWFFILFMGLMTLAMVALAIRLPGPKDSVLDLVMRIPCVLAPCAIFMLMLAVVLTEQRQGRS